jgi:hypothetical protein
MQLELIAIVFGYLLAHQKTLSLLVLQLIFITRSLMTQPPVLIAFFSLLFSL